MLLHRDSILVASQLVPRFRQLAIKIVPGWQKPRHASLHYGWCLDAAMNQNTGPAFSHSATFTNTYRRTVSVNAFTSCTIDKETNSLRLTATLNLVHLLLRYIKPNAHAKAKEPNPLAPFY
jgi:hypothetical protein